MTLQIEYIEIDKLKPYKRNNKKHIDFDIGEIAKSIEKYGMNDPIGIWKDNQIIEGHGRLEACKKLGIDKVPCIRLDHLTDKERREYAILHNKTSELAEYDFDNLAAELPDLDFSDFDFDFGIDVDDEKETEETEYEARMKEFQERMKSGELSEDDEEYQEFLAKFEAKKTTDDCYTPPIVYEAVADYVAKHFLLLLLLLFAV